MADEAPYRCVLCGADVPVDDADCKIQETGQCICRACFDRESGAEPRVQKRLQTDVEDVLRETTL